MDSHSLTQLQIIKTSPKPPARGGASFLPYQKGKFLLIGGANRNEELNDIWTLHLTTTPGSPLVGIWQQNQFQNQELYTPRSGQSSFVDKNGIIYLFGGQIFSTGQQTDEFFQLDPVKQQVSYASSKNTPAQRNSHTFTYDSETDLAYVIGGANQKGPLDDIHIYDLKTGEWEEKQLCGHNFKPREMHTTHIIKPKSQLVQPEESTKSIKSSNQFKVIELDFNIAEEEQQISGKIANINLNEQAESTQIEQKQILNQKQQENENYSYLVVLGGRSFNEVLDEIVLIDLKNFNCSLLINLSSPLCAHTSFCDNNQIVILGGFNSQNFSDDIYTFNMQSKDKLIKKSFKSYSTAIARIAIASVFSIEHQKILIFGGSSAENESNETYIVNI